MQSPPSAKRWSLAYTLGIYHAMMFEIHRLPKAVCQFIRNAVCKKD